MGLYKDRIEEAFVKIRKFDEVDRELDFLRKIKATREELEDLTDDCRSTYATINDL